MFPSSLTLQTLAPLRDSSEVVDAIDKNAYFEGIAWLEGKTFQAHQMTYGEGKPLYLKLFFLQASFQRLFAVTVLQIDKGGLLDFQCEVCKTAVRSVTPCIHQWAALHLLWRGLNGVSEELTDAKMIRLVQDLKGPLFLSQAKPVEVGVRESFEGVQFESVSLFLEDSALLGGHSLSKLVGTDLKYQSLEIADERELLSPLLWNLPKVFRQKLTAYSQHYHFEVNEQNRLASIIRYNFSNGRQLSAREILRHPLQRQVPRDILPQAKGASSVFAQWPLTQKTDHLFQSQNLKELDEVLQSLLGAIAAKLRTHQLSLFLQTKNNPGKALAIHQIEFDPSVEFDWRVEFTEKKELEAEFKLISAHKKSFSFFESFALEASEGILVVHPWLREWNLLKDALLSTVDDYDLNVPPEDMPTLLIEGEIPTKAFLRYLRTRSIPVRVSGISKTLEPQQSQTVIQLNEKGSFQIEHRARVLGRKDLSRVGWTPKSIVYLQALSQGLPFLLGSEARDLAGRAGRKREWDLKILRHLGIFQYLFLETLSFYFDKTLTDGRVVAKNEIFYSLHEKIQALLVGGSGMALDRETALVDLCSKTVLTRFEEFVAKTLDTLQLSESFYSEEGELVLEGVVEREFRLIYELLKSLAVSTAGDIFRKSRTSLLSKIWTGDPEKDPFLKDGDFSVPSANRDEQPVRETLEVLQSLIPFDFQIFFRGQPLQELNEEDFSVDFDLQSDVARADFNWFELNPRFFLRGVQINPEDMGNFGSGGVIEYEGQLFLVPKKQMPSLRRLEKFWMKLQKGKKDAPKKKGGEHIYQLPRHQTLELLALRSSGYVIRGDDEWKKLCEFYDRLGSNTRELKLPESVHAQLKPYQALGVQWLQDLYRLRLGALLADDMGLGKTLQTLSFLEDLRVKGEMGQVLIVVPSSLIFNWQSEIEKFTPLLPLVVFSNRDRDNIGHKLEAKESFILITTYGLLMEHEAFLCQYQWKILIFDEAQNLKNITTKRTSSARALPALFKICLTGTPMENHYGEFYSLVDLLVPGSLGKIEDFRRKFVNTEIVTREEIEDLKFKIKPLLLRRTKKEILDQLPEKQETKVSIAFEEQQKEIYRDIALSYNQRIQDTLLTEGEASVQLQMLTALLRLRQACSDPAALPRVRYDKVPPKLEALLDSLQEIVESGESALIFTQFLQTLEHTAKILRAAQIPVFVLHGGVPTKQRQQILSDFNKVEGGAVLVMTLKTGGVGLNLTKASYVFHLEPWWNPSVENQATDRAHRLGQSKAVQVFRYIMHESLEEKIELLKGRKDKKFQALFSSTEDEAEIGPGSGALTKDDFDLLIGVTKV